MNELLPEERVLQLILKIRNQKVMLDSDLAEMYGVETKQLNEQVKRNAARFPADFMFQVNEEEWESLKSQIATSSWGEDERFLMCLPNREFPCFPLF
jgi:hypothetical protein